jgi:hypothetical protein
MQAIYIGNYEFERTPDTIIFTRSETEKSIPVYADYHEGEQIGFYADISYGNEVVEINTTREAWVG